MENQDQTLSYKEHADDYQKEVRQGDEFIKVMGIKESTCCHEHLACYGSNESLNSTPETYIYANKMEFT